jgi:hypothetical protein
MPGMTCAVEFIVESSEDVLMVSNAALRYQPTNLSAEQIDEMVFNAGLVHLNDEQRQAAVEARAQAQEQSRQNTSQNSGQNANSGITGLMMGGPQPSARMMGAAGGTRQPRQGTAQGNTTRARQQIVMRNLWYINGDGKLDVMRVRTGISDGSSTEIIMHEEDLEGAQVILREKI